MLHNLTSSSMMSGITKSCYLQSTADSSVKILLPHNESIVVGRNETTKVTDLDVSRKQLILKANYEKKHVEASCLGKNYSAYNGFALVQGKAYIFEDGGLLELLIGQNAFLIHFETNATFDADHVKTIPQLFTAMTDPFEESNEVSKINGTWDLLDKTLLIFTPNMLQHCSHVAAFDLDGTLIKTKSGQRFPKDNSDWTVAFANAKEKIRDLYMQSGYKLVLFSNQSSLERDSHKIPQFKEKIEAILNHFALPIQVFLATGKDIYRKPAPGMWNTMINLMGDVTLSKSFYVGDAAGRGKNWAPHKPKDHSIADRLFALNIGLKFYTPEEYFLGARSVPFSMPEFDPRSISAYDVEVTYPSVQEVIIMVGSPASGKTTFYQKYLLPLGYVHVNRDSLGTQSRCHKITEDTLKQSKSVVIDNTNPGIEVRKAYIELAKKYNASCRCFYMDVTSKHSKHNAKFRSYTDKSHAVIADIIINSYYKNMQKPTLSEGFVEIVNLKFCPRFDNKDQEKLYNMFLLEN